MIIGLCSCYKEGRLVRGAVDSLAEACDRVLVYEGPAGEPLDAEVPESELEGYGVHNGRWRTDARKRQAMLEDAQRIWRRDAPDEPLWGVVVDGDEVLMNARYLPDWLLRLDYHEQINPETEYLGRPMRLMELDGSLSWVRGRLLRLDRMREYKVSTSVFETKAGVYRGGGNVPDWYDDWFTPRQGYFTQQPEDRRPDGSAKEPGRMLAMPPLPTEPFLVHRSILRHPLRSGLRLHEQEASELTLAGIS